MPHPRNRYLRFLSAFFTYVRRESCFLPLLWFRRCLANPFFCSFCSLSILCFSTLSGNCVFIPQQFSRLNGCGIRPWKIPFRWPDIHRHCASYGPCSACTYLADLLKEFRSRNSRAERGRLSDRFLLIALVFSISTGFQDYT